VPDSPPPTELPATLVELLRRRAQREPDARAITFLADGEHQEESLTYAELELDARRIAVFLRDDGVAVGARALLLYPPGLDYITAFFGCLLAGVIAVPAYPPLLNRPSSQLTTFVANATPEIALSTDAILALREPLTEQEPALGTVRWAATDAIERSAEVDWRPPPIGAETVAFIQYSSGSTAAPKGVILSHGNLLVNTTAMCERAHLGAQTRTVSWLPPYHDAGLIGKILTPLVGGFPGVLMSPIAFLQEPARWLRAIERYRATCSAAPNFGYELCVRKTTPEQRAALDLSSWRCAMNTGEPVRAQTLRRFAEAFAPAGFRYESFYPCYGLAESTVMVGGPDPAKAPRVTALDREALQEGSVTAAAEGDRVHELVACGHALPGHRVVIVEPDSRRPLAEREIGEIWVHGPSVAQGYWDLSHATEEGFRARLSDGDPTPFMRTGDLGFLDGGEVHIAARAKDLIVVRARNHYSQDIERTAEQANPALRPGCSAAFGLEEDGEERLVLVGEVDERRLGDVNAVLIEVSQAILRQHGVQPDALVLIERGALPKTSSGKQRRRETRARLLADELPVLAEWHAPRPTATSTVPASEATSMASASTAKSTVPASEAAPTVLTSTATSTVPGPGARAAHAFSTAEIERWLAHRLAGETGLDPTLIDFQMPFAAFGLDSLRAVELVAELSRWLGRQIAETAPWEHPTIARLAAYLTGETDIAAGARVRRPTAGGEPVAVVGMSCRFPGAPDLAAFHTMLRRGADGTGEVPPERWSAPAEAAAAGRGGFIEGVDLFDAAFFGIAPVEAGSIDPQQRLLLEVAWEALEHAGQAPDRLAGTATGVFVGIGTADYFHLQAEAGALTPYSATGTAHSIAANRLSYLLDLRSPSVAVDTACSSSLVAVDLACRSLRTNESDIAIAGGVNLMLTAHLGIALSRSQMLAPDGRCKVFDAAADGYARGEGCGVVVLKRLSDALRDGDRVLALVRGSAVSQDGRTSGLSAPNGAAQREVIGQALREAGVSPGDVGYVEAHGTGTALGDPIEVAALASALGPRADGEVCRIGSVKANTGHLEAAAGIAGLIKVVLALAFAELYPQPNLKQINPRIDLAGAGLEVPTELGEWATPGRPRRAGVSSFGFGGTIAHAVLEEPPTPAPRFEREERPWHLTTLSARGEVALGQLAERIARHLDPSEGRPLADESTLADESSLAGEISLADVAYTLNTGRARLPTRLAVRARSSAELRERLLCFATGESDAVAHGVVAAGRGPAVAFLFSGQGAQHAGMARELHARSPTFRAALERCAGVLDGLLGEPLAEILFGGGRAERIHQTEYAQPALVAVEIALARLWESWGIVPDAVAGHSVGEIAAAHVAGVLTLEDALAFAAERGRLMQALPAGGAMAAIMAPPDAVGEAIAGREERVAIAAHNGPEAVTISGEAEIVTELVGLFKSRGIAATPLAVSHAFHSPLVTPILEPLERAASRCRPAPPTIALAQGVTGELMEREAPAADYWRRQARSPVMFARALASLDAELERIRPEGLKVFVEIGPRPVLLGFARRSLERDGRTLLASLREDREDWPTMLDALAGLHLLGAPVDWRGFDRDYHRAVVSLPSYPFQRRRHWIDSVEDPSVAMSAIALTNGGPTSSSYPHPREPARATEYPPLPVRATEHPSSPARAGEHPLPPARAGQSASPAPAGEPPSRERLLASSAAERRGALREYLQAQLAQVLGLPVAHLDVREPLRDAGLDSIMVLEVRHHVEHALGVPLPVVSIAEGATIAELAEGLAELLEALDPHAAALRLTERDDPVAAQEVAR
jgi:acyl transferase domain-containing protein/acyl-CoA synthetase (AMP-forming)/AMP-acid ligase II